MKINYGINQPRSPQQPKLRHENHSLTHTGDWDDPAFHKHIIARILRRHPGWGITGYAPAPIKPIKRTFTIELPGDSKYPLSPSMIAVLINDDSLSLTIDRIIVREIF